MFNELIVAAVTPFSGTTTSDKNGLLPVMLQCIAGKMPNRQVLSGTVAQRMGIEVGKTYLLQVREQGYDEQFGLDFTFVKVRELESGVDIARTMSELGKPEILTVQRPAGYENTYERKGNAIEGLRTQRMREGLYKPALNTTVLNHTTAPVVEKGSSTEGDTANEFLSPEEKERFEREEQERNKRNAA